MATLTASKARAGLSDTINRVAYTKERILVERRGKPVVAVVSIEDLELLRNLEDHYDLADARAALAEAKKKGTKSLRTIKEELGL